MSEILAPLREEIDALDQEIIALLGKRMKIVHRVATIKQRENIPVVIPERIEAVMRQAETWATAHDFDPAIARQIYEILIDHACKTEEAFLSKSA